MAKTSPTQFIQQVRGETAKVTWPTRKETSLTTIMVLVMSTVAAIFFFFVDWGLSALIGLVLDIGA